MRAQLLNGTRSHLFGVRPTRGTALVNGRGRINGPEGGGPDGGGGGGNTSAIGSALSWIANHAAQLASFIGHLFQMGAGYDPTNGGEIARQFGPVSEGGTGWLGQPWCNAYMDWVRKYRPDLWNSGDVWDETGIAHPSRWREVYDRYVAAGMPPGTLLDANMVPVGLAAAQAAVQQEALVQNNPTVPPPNAQQIQALQVLAMQLAGLGTPADRAAAAATVAMLPNGWRNYVNALVAIWQASDEPAPGPDGGPAQAGMNPGLLLAALAAAVILSNK